MAPNQTRAEIEAEIARLRICQMESSVNAIEAGWRPEELVKHRKRAERITALRRQPAALDET